MSDDMITFLLARIEEEQQLARVACTRGQGQPEHWQWVATETDEPVPDTDLNKAIEDQNLSLRSVEEYPTVTGMLSSFAIHEIDEITPALPHIAHWDPARVLAECETKRRIIELPARNHECSTYDHHGEIDHCTWVIDDCSTLLLLALLYASHPNYREKWRP